MTPARLAESFDSLTAEGELVVSAAFDTGTIYGKHVDKPALAGWAVNCLALVRSIFGLESDHYVALHTLSCERNSLSNAKALLSVLQAANRAWNNGYIFDVKALARADVEADLIEQATVLLDGGYDRAAAVVAGAVVEERLRAVAKSWGVALSAPNGKLLTLGPLNDELKKAGAYDGIMQKRITLLGGLRNKAAHGEEFESRTRDVESMIRDAVAICGTVLPK